MNQQLAGRQKQWAEEIFVDPSRLAMGIRGETAGDIQAAYCADTFPKIRTFVHDGHLFTNCGGRVEQAMDCYPLIPEAVYQGPEPKEFTYEGRAVVYRGQHFKLGAQVTFRVRERSLEEWTNLLRREYGHGGQFAAGKAYGEVLLDFMEFSGTSDGQRLAIQSELARADLEKTQEEMLERLSREDPSAHPTTDDTNSQLTLPGL